MAMKSTRIRLARHVAHMGEMRNVTKFWLGKLKGLDYMEDLGIEGKILEWDLGK
jgi:hypothetical protein